MSHSLLLKNTFSHSFFTIRHPHMYPVVEVAFFFCEGRATRCLRHPEGCVKGGVCMSVYYFSGDEECILEQGVLESVAMHLERALSECYVRDGEVVVDCEALCREIDYRTLERIYACVTDYASIKGVRLPTE